MMGPGGDRGSPAAPSFLLLNGCAHTLHFFLNFVCLLIGGNRVVASRSHSRVRLHSSETRVALH
eukprot:scaffold47950_cov33-Tisochrysis_lutea.AAC.3